MDADWPKLISPNLYNLEHKKLDVQLKSFVIRNTVLADITTGLTEIWLHTAPYSTENNCCT